MNAVQNGSTIEVTINASPTRAELKITHRNGSDTKVVTKAASRTGRSSFVYDKDSNPNTDEGPDLARIVEDLEGSLIDLMQIANDDV